MDWCTIESDPGVFSELIATVGVKDVKVEELYDLEGLGVDSSHKVYGMNNYCSERKEEEEGRKERKKKKKEKKFCSHTTFSFRRSDFPLQMEK